MRPQSPARGDESVQHPYDELPEWAAVQNGRQCAEADSTATTRGEQCDRAGQTGEHREEHAQAHHLGPPGAGWWRGHCGVTAVCVERVVLFFDVLVRRSTGQS